ncbi:hypothetical protein C900_05105 [Fulvivirga imtechensis AK7]|uniref:Lipoprotein n=1 Tax=Fulvivirga imtechensis AK7 TaxID=1237149 RepID=L8JKL1_9BACT|nr:hypothetical protein [Fulvivirga imtechensis]ELR69325.1 hypothetical protein C900_05105 [Fulvivirga imtechensis AK7]
MRLLLVILCISGLALFSCDNEDNVVRRFENYFIKYYGEEGNQYGYDVQKLNSGFIILGHSTSLEMGRQILVVKVDELGNMQWHRQFGGAGEDTPAALRVDAAGNFIIASTIEVAPGDQDIMILKIDSNGVKLDSAIFGYPGKLEVARNITITAEGDFIVTGSTTNVDTSKPGFLASTDLEDIYSIRTNSDLVQYSPADWRRVYGFPGIDRGVEVKQKNDGSFLFFGTTNKPPTSNSQQAGFNMFLFPAGTDGIASSASQLQLFGTLSNEEAQAIIRTSEGGFTMLGTSTGQGLNAPFLARVRSNNDFVSSGTIPVERNVVANSIVEASTGGFIVLGEEIGNGTDTNIYLTRVAANGSVVWSQSFGGLEIDSPGRVLELEDGSIVFVGTVTLDSQAKICLIKTNPIGELKP